MFLAHGRLDVRHALGVFSSFLIMDSVGNILMFLGFSEVLIVLVLKLKFEHIFHRIAVFDFANLLFLAFDAFLKENPLLFYEPFDD